MLDGTLDVPSTESNLPQEQGLGSQLHLLGSKEVVQKQEELLPLESVLTAEDLRKSLQQQGLSGRPFLQDQQRSFLCLKLRYARPFSFSQRTTRDLIAGPALTKVILRLPVHILFGSRECILLEDSICIKSSHTCRLVHSYNTRVEVAASLNLVVICSACLSDLIALPSGGFKIVASRRPPKVRQRIFDLRVRLESELSSRH